MQSQNFNHVQSCPFLPGALGDTIFSLNLSNRVINWKSTEHCQTSILSLSEIIFKQKRWFNSNISDAYRTRKLLALVKIHLRDKKKRCKQMLPLGWLEWLWPQMLNSVNIVAPLHFVIHGPLLLLTTQRGQNNLVIPWLFSEECHQIFTKDYQRLRNILRKELLSKITTNRVRHKLLT